MSGLLMFVPIIVIFYFLLIRPQQKRAKDLKRMQEDLKVGDRVLTTGGMHGTISGISENTITLKVAEKVKIDFDRSGIIGLQSTGPDSK